MENRRNTKKISEKIDKLDKQKEKTSVANIRNERGEFTIQSTSIKRLVSMYYEYLCQ